MITINEETYKFKFFEYQSGRKGIMLIDKDTGKDLFPATLDMSGVTINSNEIIVKNHDLNYGVLDALTKADIIGKQQKPITLGFNTVYICKLKHN